MQVSQIQHCSIAVRDLDRAAAFYRDVLGLTEIKIPDTFIPAGVNVRWFKVGDQQIHLLPESEAHEPSGRHVALQVADAVAARAWMHEKGLKTSETVLIPGTDRFFISDPDGNQIEIIEWKQAYVSIPVDAVTVS
jgi:catechol 2,3-dioxygenase-like lactoylglutathione lyase family enzyme